MDGKNKIGFVQKCQYKLAAILNVISNDLTTDAVPDKKYHEPVKCGKQPQLNGCEETSVCSTESTFKPCTELILKENKNDKKKSENLQKYNVSCEDDNVYNMKGKPKKSDFSFGQTKNKQEKSSDKRRHNYIENKKVYNISHSENVHIGNSYVQNIGFNSSDNERKRVHKTPEIIDMMQCKDAVTTEHILEVAPHVGKNWKTLGRHLKFSDGQLEQLQDNNKNNLREVVSELLRDWIELETDNATIGLLCQYMWKSNEKIAVEKLVTFVNKESKNKTSDKK